MTLSRHNRHHPTRIGASTEENFSPETRSHLSDKSLERNRLDGFDYLTCLLTIILIAFGVLTIYSATYNPEVSSWLTGHCRKQLIWIAIALIVGMALFVVHYNFFYQAAYPLYGLGIILLLAVEVAGSTHMGATRWLSLGGMNIQPSEFAKLTVILALSRYLSDRRLPPPYNLKELIVPAIFIALPAALILKQPDLGTAMLIILISGVIIFMAGITRGTIITLGFSALSTALIGWQFLHDYQRQRILTFLDPEKDPLGSGYHIAQSKIAIGAGKLFGKGFLKGTQNSLHFLPEQHTDFIFAAYAEQWGFLGVLILLALYFTFLFRALHIAMEARDSFGSYLATGIGAIFFWQVTINVGMVSGLMPVVGIPLPLFSYGGTSMLTSIALISILLNIHYRRKG